MKVMNRCRDVEDTLLSTAVHVYIGINEPVINRVENINSSVYSDTERTDAVISQQEVFALKLDDDDEEAEM